MIFGETPLEQAEGAILAHSLKVGGRTFKKGRRLSADDLAALGAADYRAVVAARLEPGDVHEDAAAAALTEALCGNGLSVSAAFTGRCNLIAESRGLLVLDRDRLDALNLIDEALTVATLAPFEPIEPRQMAATVKVIPFALPGAVLERCLTIARDGGPLLRVAAYLPRQVGLVQTSLPGVKPSVLDKTRAALDARLAALGCPPAEEVRCTHDAAAVAEAIADLRRRGARIVLVSGASAIVDRRDVVPAGILRAGGTIDHFGMPVDPGNLLLLAHIEAVPVLGLPGCARSPKVNGFDWVLQRLVAELAVTARDVMRMGAGGLLKEIPARGLPRAEAVETAGRQTDLAAGAPRNARIGALLLAAGRSRRMGPANKLLAEVEGRPMVARVAERLLASKARPIVAVTGHERTRVEAALNGLELTLAHNPDYAAGLSTSLSRGLGALPGDLDGVLVCLGDMPNLTPAVLDRLIAAFNPVEGRAICLPTWRGKRGNPLLFARRFFAEMQEIAGDVGARHLIGQYPEVVCEVAMDNLPAGEGILTDIDTPEALTRLRPAG